MKDKMKKFYHDHEQTLHIIGTTAGITTIVVATVVAKAAANSHTIVSVNSAILDDVEHLLITKKNGQTITNFQRAVMNA